MRERDRFLWGGRGCVLQIEMKVNEIDTHIYKCACMCVEWDFMFFWMRKHPIGKVCIYFIIGR